MRSTASGQYAVAIGRNAVAGSNNAIAIGQNAVAQTGANAVAIGSATATGSHAYALGQGATASGTNAMALGRNMAVSGTNSVGIALDNTGYTLSQNNALAIMGGNVGIGTVSPGSYRLSVVGGDAYFDGNLFVNKNIFLKGNLTTYNVQTLRINGSLTPYSTSFNFDIGNSSRRWRDGWFNGNLYLGEYLYHADDLDTYLRFTDNNVLLSAGNTAFIELNGAVSPRQLVFNKDSENLDIILRGDNDASLLFTKGSTDRVGIGTNDPGAKLDVRGAALVGSTAGQQLSIDASGHLSDANEPVTIQDQLLVDDTSTTALVVRKDGAGATIFSVDTAGNQVHIGTGFAGTGATFTTAGALSMDDDLLVGGGDIALTGGSTTITATTTGGSLTIKSDSTGALTLDSGTTGQVNLGTGNDAKTINIGTGTGANTLVIGTTSGAASTTIRSGTGDLTLQSTDQILLSSSKGAGGTTTEALSLKTSTNLGAFDEVVQIGDSAADFVTVLGEGNVGIGTSSPGTRLEIAGGGSFSYPTLGTGKGQVHLKQSGTNDQSAAITFSGNSGSEINSAQAGIYVQSSGSYGTRMYFATTDSFATGSQARMMINSNGNVGINTLGPDARLDVLASSGPQLRLTHTDDTKFVDFTLDTNHYLTIKPSSTGRVIIQPTTNSANSFQVLNAAGGTPILNVDTSNNRIGINTASPNQALHVVGNANITGSLYVGGAQIYASNAMNAAGDLTIDGNVTLGNNPANDWTLIRGSAIVNANKAIAALIVNQSGSGNLLEVRKSNTQHLYVKNTGIVHVGSGGSETYMDGTGDVYIQDVLEVDGSAYLGDGTGTDTITLNAGSGTILLQTDTSGGADTTRIAVGTGSSNVSIDITNSYVNMNANKIINVNAAGYNAVGCTTKTGPGVADVACAATDEMISLRWTGTAWKSVCCRVI
ncbi:MAG: hypothetical protein QW594_03555 [Candidatus Woesearchaeota archaeon]